MSVSTFLGVGYFGESGKIFVDLSFNLGDTEESHFGPAPVFVGAVFVSDGEGPGGAKKLRSCNMPEGTVKWFNNTKGSGFIQSDEGGDVFVHQTEIQTDGYRSLQEGSRVQFELTKGDKGPKAAQVKVIG